jgi:predicted ferric reductase
MYGGTLLAFGHQQELGNTLNSDNLFSFYWLVIFAATFLTLGIFRFLWPLYYFYQHRFFVEKITQETPNTWSVFIRGTNLQNFKVRAGQFFIARFFAKGYFLEAHPFSLSEEPNPDYLRLTIKASGDFTAKVAQIPLGTKVYLEGPYGIFTADKANADKILLLAGGIGITPIRAMLKDFGKANRDIVLIYGNKTSKDIAFKDELEELAKKYDIQIHYVLSSSAETANPKSEAPNSKLNTHYGFITTELISRLVPDYLEREVFLCGPPPMMNGLIASLKQKGLPTRLLHFEKFTF